MNVSDGGGARQSRSYCRSLPNNLHHVHPYVGSHGVCGSLRHHTRVSHDGWWKDGLEKTGAQGLIVRPLASS